VPQIVAKSRFVITDEQPDREPKGTKNLPFHWTGSGIDCSSCKGCTWSTEECLWPIALDMHRHASPRGLPRLDPMACVLFVEAHLTVEQDSDAKRLVEGLRDLFAQSSSSWPSDSFLPDTAWML
jgi:hypothetical protein